MIKPDSFRNFLIDNIDSPELIKNVACAIGKAEKGESNATDGLSSAEKALFMLIRRDSDAMDVATKQLREEWRNRQNQSRKERKSRDVTQCHRDTHDVTVHPIILPTDRPTNLPTNLKNRSDADTRVREGSPYGRGGSASASESELIAKAVSELPTKGRRTDLWRWSNDDIRGRREDCPVDTAAMLSCAFGKGSWRKVVAQAGDDPVRELFITFRNEISLGEHVDNPAAAFSERCKHDLGVDFKLTMAESIKRGKSPDGTLNEDVA